MKKKVKVVMLPTDEVSNIFYLKENSRYKNKIEYSENNPKHWVTHLGWQYQHLYFLSDEEIKEGDWYYDSGDENFICKAFSNTKSLYNRQKIIATTDESLYYEKESWFSSSKSLSDNKVKIYLPRPSNEFLKAYCKAGGIDEVEVEYETIQTTKKEDYQYQNGQSNLNYITKLKVAPDNTITIYPVKDTWSREEVVELIKDFNSETVEQRDSRSLTDWIKENL